MGYAVLKAPEFDTTDDARIPSEPNHGLYLCSKPFVFGQPVPDDSVWTGIWGNLRDALFPKKLPPLKLTSRPVAVADPMASRRDPTSSVIAFTMHVLVVVAILWLGLMPHPQVVIPKHTITPITFQPYIPPVTAPAPKVMGGGGGGGAHQVVEPTKGHLPPVEKLRVIAPQIIRIDNPKLAAQPSIVMPQRINIPDNNMPNLGMPQSPQVAMASQGDGGGSGFGAGMGGGIGSGIGGGVGPGSGGGYGGGVMSVGAGVSAPELLHSVEPEFTDQARAARYQGVVAIQLIVDSYGNPEDIQIVKHLGMGLDQKAIDAVRQYKFRPAMYQGHPVPVRLVVDVNFHLY
ncbi:MAG: energy transducer TonB [Acidobacteriaceae bacterium]